MNGYIEEMMSGQKVIKVFSREEKSLEEFNGMNEELRDSANKANGMANILMPVVAQLGNLRYVIVAVAGACLAVNGKLGLSIGTLVSFMTLNKSFANPPVLILDEATSSIDTRTEQLVQKGMDSLMQGRTTFVIAHRLSTVKNSNCIMVLEQGHIIERGSHEELIGQKGRYYQLYTGNLADPA